MGKKSKKKDNAQTKQKPVNTGGVASPVLFGIGGHCRPSIAVGRYAMVLNLKSRPELNGDKCIVEKLLKSGRVAVKMCQNEIRKTYSEPEVISVSPLKLEMIWDLPSRSNPNNDEDEICPVCCDTVLITNETCSLFACCGARICNQCFARCCMGPDPDRCPFCRSSTKDTSDEAEIAKIRARANRGDANACYNLGGYYDFGGKFGIQQDQKKAREWYKIATLKGEVRAAQNLGCCHRDGEGGPIDLVEAAKYFRIAAEGGYVPGITNLGIAYLYGHGVKTDFQEAEKWLKLGAKRGDQMAADQLMQFSGLINAQRIHFTPY